MVTLLLLNDTEASALQSWKAESGTVVQSPGMTRAPAESMAGECGRREHSNGLEDRKLVCARGVAALQ